MKQYKRTVDGVVEYFSEPLIADGKQIFNPSEEMILAAGWEEYSLPKRLQVRNMCLHTRNVW